MIHPDYQYTPALIPAMASLVASGLYPCVLGSRILGGGALRGGMPWWKYVSNRFLTLTENLLARRQALRISHRLPRLLPRAARTSPLRKELGRFHLRQPDPRPDDRSRLSRSARSAARQSISRRPLRSASAPACATASAVSRPPEIALARLPAMKRGKSARKSAKTTPANRAGAQAKQLPDRESTSPRGTISPPCAAVANARHLFRAGRDHLAHLWPRPRLRFLQLRRQLLRLSKPLDQRWPDSRRNR